jgi:hypothetical protein
MSYVASHFRVDDHQIWNLIVGVQYVTVGSYGYMYGDVLTALSEDMGDEFKKPVVLLSLNQMRKSEFEISRNLELFDYEYGV